MSKVDLNQNFRSYIHKQVKECALSLNETFFVVKVKVSCNVTDIKCNRNLVLGFLVNLIHNYYSYL